MWFRAGRANHEGLLKEFSRVSAGIEDAAALVGRQRGRPIRLLPGEFGSGTLSGLWIACDSTDYIVHPSDALPTRRTAIIAHELAHMLLRHEPQTTIEGAEQLAKVLAPTLDPSIARRLLARHAECTPEEIEAERLGTELLARLSLSTSAMSQDPILHRLLA